MITQTMHIVILCHVVVVLILQQLPPVASQAPLAPSSRNCMAQPCAYRGECRGASNECGDTVAYCNAESIWVPSCGGGANLDKPAPRGPPTMPPTSGPTTAWEKWISNSNGNSKREEEDNNGRNEDNNAPATTTTTSFSNTSANNNGGGQQQQGVQPGQTTNNQDPSEGANGEEYIPNNQTGTFDAEGWGYYGEEEEEGILDKAKFWENDSSAKQSAVTEVVFLVGAVVAWAVLL